MRDSLMLLQAGRWLKLLGLGTILLLTCALVLPAGAAQRSAALDQALATAGGDAVPVLMYLNNRVTMDELYPVAASLPMSERRAYVVRTLKQRFREMSRELMPQLLQAQQGGRVSRVRPLWVLNAVRVRMNVSMLNTLDAAFPEVAYMDVDMPQENTLDEMGWGIREMQVDRVWSELGVDGSGVIVGHKDAGLDTDHPGFLGHLWVNPGEDLNGNGTVDSGEANGADEDGNGYVDDFYGWDFDEDNSDVNDSPDAGTAFGHGTRTAGVISARHTPCDTISVAPGAKLMVLSAFQSQGAVWEASQYAIEMGAHVISASLSFKWGNCWDPNVLECPNYVAHRMVSEVELAAGLIHANSTGNTTQYQHPVSLPAPSNSPPPAMTPEHPLQGGVSSIVSVNSYGVSGSYLNGAHGPAGWSREDLCIYHNAPFCGPEGSGNEYPPQYNDYPWLNGTQPGLPKPDVIAPTGVNSLNVNGGCGTITGTSGATPHVGGTLALIYSAFPGITPERAYLLLINNAVDGGLPGLDSLYGFGKIRPFLACSTGFATLGRVHGLITSGGQPVPDVRIATEVTEETQADEHGEYYLALPPGTHVVRFEKYGFVPVESSLTVVAGQTLEHDFAMTAAAMGTIVGSVSGAGAGPLGGIPISIPEIPFETVTGPGGQFTAELFAGNYTLYAGTLPWDVVPLEVELGPGSLNLDIVLTRSPVALPTYGDPYSAYDDYDVDEAAFDWVEINPNVGGLPGETLPLDGGGDGTITRTLPFTFTFYGQEYSQITISANGFIAMGAITHNSWAVEPIPDTIAPNGYIAVWRTDWIPPQGGRVLYYADTDNHRVIVEWHNVPHFFGSTRVTFQGILYDPDFYPTATGDGQIKLQYNSVPRPHEGVIGVESPDGTQGLQYVFQLVYEEHAAPIQTGRAILITTDSLFTSIDEPGPGTTLPAAFELAQNYPNPFNPTTTFSWMVPRAADVRLALYDVLGREAAVVFEGRCEAGVYRQEFNAAGLATGIYFARLEAAGQAHAVRKVMLLK